MSYDLKQSGDKYEHTTGAVRDKREGKGRFDLISPRFLYRLALVMEKGAKYYGERNWEKGMPLHLYLDSAMRHISQVLLHKKDEDHAAQAAWNLMAFIHTAELISNGQLPWELDTVGYCKPEIEPTVGPSPVTSGVKCPFPNGCKDHPIPLPASLMEQFLHYLKGGPRAIDETLEYLHNHSGFKLSEVIRMRRELSNRGLIRFSEDGCYYKLVGE